VSCIRKFSGLFEVLTQLIDLNRNIFERLISATQISNPYSTHSVALVANGLPTSYAAQAYVQLLTATSPEANVLVGSDVEPYASQSRTDTALAILTNEMRQSALPRVSGTQTVLKYREFGHAPILIRMMKRMVGV
jgi:hypothetical protein